MRVPWGSLGRMYPMTRYESVLVFFYKAFLGSEICGIGFYMMIWPAHPGFGYI